MKTYSTTEIAKIIGIHPNTVRKYESLGFIPVPERKVNGYRVFTHLHVLHLQLVRTAFDVELLQSGLRKKALMIVTTAAKSDYTNALMLANDYLECIKDERMKANEALTITKHLIDKAAEHTTPFRLTRQKTAELLDVTIDTLRNWELNGLLTVKRKENGYRIYNEEDIKILKIIRTLRCANYSLSAIFRMLNVLSENETDDIYHIIDTPKESEMIISACDRLLTSLNRAEANAEKMIVILNKISNPPL